MNITQYKYNHLQNKLYPFFTNDIIHIIIKYCKPICFTDQKECISTIEHYYNNVNIEQIIFTYGSISEWTIDKTKLNIKSIEKKLTEIDYPQQFLQNINIIEFLLRNGFDIDVKNETDETFLDMCCYNHYIESTRYLLKCGADVHSHSDPYDTSEYTVYTPIMIACSNGYFDIAELLLKYNANIKDIVHHLSPYFYEKITEKQKEILFDFIMEHDTQLDATTMLQFCFNINMDIPKKRKIVKQLLDMKADPNYWSETFSSIPLHNAVLKYEADYECIRMLLESKANPNYILWQYYRDKCKTESIMNLLLSYATDVNERCFIEEIIKNNDKKRFDYVIQRSDFNQYEYALSISAEQCNVYMSKCLIDMKADVNLFVDFQTPLIGCCKGLVRYHNTPKMKDCYNLLKYILDKKANPNYGYLEEKKGIVSSPMSICLRSSFNSLKWVQLLIDYKIDVHDDYMFNVCPTKLGVQRLQLLIQHKIEIHKRNRDNETILIHMVGKPHCKVSMVESLLSLGIDIHARCELGYTALLNSLIYPNPNIVKCLLKHKANIDDVNDFNENALFFSNLNHMKLLIQHKVDINHRNNEGQTPLIRQSDRCNPDFQKLKCLIKYKADINLVDNRRLSMLHYVLCWNKDEEKETTVKDFFQFLIEKKANLYDHHNNSPLQSLLQTDMVYTDLVKIMADNMAYLDIDINHKNHKGETALHTCCLHGHRDVVFVLLECKADIHIQNNRGQTCLDYASDNQFNDIVQLLT